MFQNKSYVVIGASGSIGSQLAKQLVMSGAKVLLAGKTESKLRQLGSDLDMPYQAVDATDIKAVEDLLNDAVEKWRVLSGAVNCVGSILLKPAHLTTEQEWLETLSLNLTSAFALVRAASKILLNTGGSIVLTSAAIATVGMPNHEAISAAKAGVNGLMRSAAATYAANNLRFNCVAPGLVDTALTEKITKNPKSLAYSLDAHPLGRIGNPKDIANAIIFLLHPDNSWITGQILTVDGGLSALKVLAKDRT